MRFLWFAVTLLFWCLMVTWFDMEWWQILIILLLKVANELFFKYGDKK